MKNLLNYSIPDIGSQEKVYIDKLFTSNIITRGDACKEFENKIIDLVGCTYSVILPNATIGLYLVNKFIGKKIHHTVTPITFMASANAIELNKQKIVFNDINSITNPNMNTSNISTDVVTVVHYAGVPIELDTIKNKIIVEDAAHAFGSKYLDGTMVGNCKYSLATVFSFHAVKNITMMEGGLVTTNNKDLYDYLIKMRNHGIENVNYELNELSLNFNVTEAQALIGLAQLTRLNEFFDKKRMILEFYKSNLKCRGIEYTPNTFPHIYPVIVYNKNKVIKRLLELGINPQTHYFPVNRLNYYKQKYNCTMPNSELYYLSSISIPFYTKLTVSQLNDITVAVNTAYEENL